MSKRLFIALELPLVSRERLARLDPHIRGARWVAAEQMHLTLSFLGEVSSENENRLRHALAAVRVGPFFLPLEGVGTFGGERPTVIWAGVGRGHPHLFALHKRIQDEVLRAGLEPDLRPFQPHVTLGRARNVARHDLKPFLQEHKKTEFDFFQVTGFALFSSAVTESGARYAVELRVEF